MFPKDKAGNATQSRRASLGDVERAILAVRRQLHAKLGRAPTAGEIGACLGLGAAQVKPRLAALESIGLTRGNARGTQRRARVGEVEREILAAQLALRAKLERRPTEGEIGGCLGLAAAQVRQRLALLRSLGFTRSIRTAPARPHDSKKARAEVA